MLRVIIIDDEKPSLNLLSQMLEARGDVSVVGAYTKPSELLSDAAMLMPDAVFLDIELPGMSGLELAGRLLELSHNIEIVFVTAYKQYALEAFDSNAIDYILKPVQPVSIGRALDRLQKRLRPGEAVGRAKEAHVEALGDLAVYASGSDVPLRFPTNKTEELFAFLLAHREMNAGKWAISESLWPGFTPDKAEQNLHTTVFRLKKTLKESGLDIAILSQRGYYRLETELLSDYTEYDRLVRKFTDGGLNPDELQRAAALYRGQLFGSRDYAWCEPLRERLNRQFGALTKKLSRTLTIAGDRSAAVDVLLRAVELLPYDEEAYELLLRHYAEAKDRTSFVHYYDKLERWLRAELDVVPGFSLRALYEEMKHIADCD